MEVAAFIDFIRSENDSTKTNAIGERVDWAEIKRFAEYNDVSPSQLKTILSKNRNVSTLEEEITAVKLTPDVEYLIQKYEDPCADIDITASENIASKVLLALQYGDCVGLSFANIVHGPVNSGALNPFYTLGTGYSEQAKAILRESRVHKWCPNYKRALTDMYRVRPDAVYTPAFAHWAKTASETGYHGLSPECMVRVTGLVFSIRNYDKAVREAVKTCMVTHNHTESVKAVIVWSTILRLCYAYDIDTAKQKIISYLIHCYGYHDLDAVRYRSSKNESPWYPYEDDGPAHQPDDTDSATFYAPYALWLVCDHFVKSDTKEKCLLGLLDSYGDLDAVCAMACSLWVFSACKE